MSKNEQFDYAKKMSELEGIVDTLQRGDVSIDEAIKLHGQAKELADQLSDYLNKMEIVIRDAGVEMA